MRRASNEAKQLHNAPHLLIGITLCLRRCSNQTRRAVRQNIRDLREPHHQRPHCPAHRAEENHVAAENLHLPSPKVKRTPVEEHVKEEVPSLLAFHWSHLEPERHCINGNLSCIVKHPPNNLLLLPWSFLLPLALVHCENSQSHPNRPLAYHDGPKQTQPLSYAHEHHVVHQTKVHEREHAIARRIRRLERRVGHGDRLREVVEEPRRNGRAERERQQHTIKMAVAQAQHPARYRRRKETAELYHEPKQPKRLTHVVL